MWCLLLALFAAVALSQSCSNDVSLGSLPVRVNGATEYMALSKSYVGNPGPSISGTTMTAPMGWRAALATGCPTAKSATMFRKFNLLGASLGFTLNIGGITCGCNFAVYFVKMPAYDSNGNPVPGSSNLNDYYCDANQVGGTFCPEIDLVEGNSRGFQATPHACSAPSNKHYSSCDTGGCTRNAVRNYGTNAYGYGSGYTIDTSQAFALNFTFVKNSNNQWSKMITTFTQSNRKLTMVHDSSVCSGQTTLPAMTTDLTDGMTLVFSHWNGDVSWLDNPPCTNEGCSSGTVTFSDMWFNSGSYNPVASSSKATVQSSSKATVQSSSKATVQSSSKATVKSSSKATVQSSTTTVRSSSKATVQSSSKATVQSSSKAAVKSSGTATTGLCGTYNCRATGCAQCTSFTPGWCSETADQCNINCNGIFCPDGTYTPPAATDDNAENTPVGEATATAVSVAATALAVAALL